MIKKKIKEKMIKKNDNEENKKKIKKRWLKNDNEEDEED